jgi:hypothetical protein
MRLFAKKKKEIHQKVTNNRNFIRLKIWRWRERFNMLSMIIQQKISTSPLMTKGRIYMIN